MAQTSITSFFKIIKKNAGIKKEKPENDTSFKDMEKEQPGVQNGKNIKQFPKIKESPTTSMSSMMDASFKDTKKEQLTVQNGNAMRYPKKQWLDSSTIKQCPKIKETPSTSMMDTSLEDMEKEQLAVQNGNPKRSLKKDWLDSGTIKQCPKIKASPSTSVVDTSFEDTEKKQLAVQNGNAKRSLKKQWLDSSTIKQCPKIKETPSTSMMDTSFEGTEKEQLAVQNGNAKRSPKEQWLDSSRIKQSPKIKKTPSTSMMDTSFKNTKKEQLAVQNENAMRYPKKQWLDSITIKQCPKIKKTPSTSMMDTSFEDTEKEQLAVQNGNARTPKIKKSPSTSVMDSSFEDTDNKQPAVQNGSTKKSSKRRLDFSSSELQTPKKKSPSTGKMRHPSSTPEMATPKRAASRVPRTPRKPRRILTLSQFYNSGSELEDGESDREDEGGDQPDPVNMREVVRQLRGVAIMEEEGDLETLAVLEQGFDVPIAEQEEVVETWEVIEFEFGEAGTEGPDASFSCSEDLSTFLGQERRVAILEEEGDMEALAVLEQGSDVPIVERKEVVETSEVREVGESGKAGTEGPDASFSWSEDFSTFLGQEEMYKRNPGPRIPTGDILDIFMAIWDLSIFTTIVKQTNLYAWQTIARMSELGPLPKYLDAWVDTTVYEIAGLFGVLIYMSLNYRACVKEYWTTGPLGMPDFRKFMSRNRFQLLMRFLHFTDNDNVQIGMTSYQKKIAKIAPIVEHMNRKFAEIYVPQRELSLDESLLLWKGRLSWVQCIRSKAARFGLKLFELCEAATGYLIRTIIYAGKDSSFVDGALHGFDNKTAKVVLELMDGFLDVGHLVVMDNWYNQLVLTRYLKSRHTDVLGTINKNRQHIPDAIKTLNESKMKRGDRIARHCGDIAVTGWKDVKLVTVVSTCHGDELMVGSRAKQEHIKPVAVDRYNHSMGGVDLKDMKLSAFPMERKRGRKWYIKVFAHYLNTSILNSFIIYSRNPSLTAVSHRAFRYALADSLVKIGQPNAVPRPIIDTTSVRLDREPDHYPIHTDSVEGKAVKHKRVRCKRCTAAGKRTTVMTMCQKCCVALCLGQCWIDYHTKDTLK